MLHRTGLWNLSVNRVLNSLPGVMASMSCGGKGGTRHTERGTEDKKAHPGL